MFRDDELRRQASQRDMHNVQFHYGCSAVLNAAVHLLVSRGDHTNHAGTDQADGQSFTRPWRRWKQAHSEITLPLLH